VYDSPATGSVVTYTYRELRDAVARFAGALAALGVEKGDRVVVYMPMVPEAAIAMLACARLGAVHSVVFGGFAPHELAIRIDDARPKVVVSASCGIEGSKVIEYKPLLDRAIDLAGSSAPDHCVILQRPQVEASLVAGRDVAWADAVAAAEPHPCVSVEATDPLYVLYTSGTTGKPKGVVRDNGGHAVALRWSMPNVYDVQPGEVFWAASDVGWVVGHSYIVYAPLLSGCTTRAPSGGWRPSMASRCCSPRPPRCGPSRRRTPPAPSSRATTSPGCGPCSSPASAPTRTPTTGPSTCSASR
jgi:propionyl-CoA synthetase